MQDYILELALSIDKQKTDVIKTRLNDLGITIDWELEKTRRFKSITNEQHPDRDEYYYNDGSEKGVRIITFEEVRDEVDFTNYEFSLGIKYKYY